MMNWKQEAEEMLEGYKARKQSILNLEMEIRRLESELVSLRSPSMDTPVTGVCTREDKVLNNIVKRKALSRAREEAMLWVKAADNALGALLPEQRELLNELYIQPKRGSLQLLADLKGVPRSTIYRRRDDALRCFTLAMYGKA